MATDFSLRATSINPEPIRESPIDRSGALLGQGMAAASGIQARGIYNEAQAAQNFGQVAPALSEATVNATIGYQKAQLDKQIGQEIQDYVDAKRDPQENLIGYAQAGVLEQESQGIWDRLGKGEVSSETFVDSVNAFDSQTKRLVKTYEQGLMQPSELVNRVMAITREHIARNPGLTDELFKQAQRTLQITGIAGMRDIKAEEDKTALEIEKAAKKSLKESLNRLGIVPDWTQFEMDPAYRGELNIRAQEKQQALDHFKATKEGYNLEELKTKSEVQNYFRTEAPMQMVGFREEFAFNMSQILNSGIADDMKLNQMDGLIASSKATMAEYFGTKGVLSDPNAKVWMDQFEAFAQGTVDQIRSAKTQADKVAIVQNQVRMQELLSEERLNDKMDYATRKFIASIQSDTMMNIAFKNPVIGKQYMNALIGVVDDGLRNHSSITQMFTTEGSVEPDITDGAATMKWLIEHKHHDQLDKVVGAYLEAQGAGKLSEVDQFNNMDDFFNLASRNIDKMSEVSETTKRNFYTVTTNYMTLLGKSFNSFINSNREYRNTNFTVEELPYGGIIFNSPNKEFEQKLNNTYADKFNKIIKVTAPMDGISQKQSYERHKAFFDSTFRIGRGRETGAPGTTVFKPVQLKIDPRLDQVIEQQAQSHDLDPNLVRAVIKQESGGKTNAVSPKGALGLMQLMPDTAGDLGVDPNNPAENIVGGIRYLKQQIDRFGSIELGLAAYNAGPRRVQEAGGIPNIKETQDYVKNIMASLGRE